MKVNFVLLPLLVSVFLGTLRIFLKKRWMNVLEITLVILTLVPLFMFKPFGTFTVGPWSSAVGVEIRYSPTSFWFILSLVVVWVSFKARFVNWDSTMESLADYLFSAMYALFISNDIFNVYVTMELASLVSFLMVGYGKKAQRIWAALKYIFLSVVALSLYLVGVALIYSQDGVLSLSALKGEKIPVFALAFVVIALLVKGGTFALSSWMVDVYYQSKEAVSALLSGTSVNMGLYAMILFFPLLNWNLKEFIVAFGIFSAIVGSIYALGEKKRGKVLAFSTSSQMGIAFAFLGISPTACAMYAFAHSISKSLLFSSKEKISTFLAVASLVGLFPLAGYFAKIGFMKEFPFLSVLIVFLTSAYAMKLLNISPWKPMFYEGPLIAFLFFPLFFMPFGNYITILEISAVALSGFIFGTFFSFPTLKDVFSLENGMIYEVWALAGLLIWLHAR